ncbi:MAG: serine hydroxymethyltransferase [bacterium]|nr:serine hydroxymethyltransferase [bacterium]
MAIGIEASLASVDPHVAGLVNRAGELQGTTLALIPSVNHSSSAVRQAVGSVLDHSYSEGYPGKRYYQGQEVPDAVERLAIERAKELFGVPHVNVQPLSGSPANMAVYSGLLSGGENRGKIMGLDLPSGGHLTHGAKASLSSRFFDAVPYGTDPEGWIDYDGLEERAQAERPDIIVAGTTAYSRRLDWERFREIADKSRALLMADVSHIAGLIAGGAYPSPVEYVDIMTTTTHKTLRGPRGAMIMVTERGLNKDDLMGEKIDRAVFPGMQGGPHINTIAGIAVALHEAAQPEFKTYAKQVVSNAEVLAAELRELGIQLVTGGTDSHLFLIDLRNNNGITGNTVAEGFERAGIIVNRNAVPHDEAPAYYPSGIRVGTPAITSRGMGEKEMLQIADWMSDMIHGFAGRKDRLGIDRKGERNGSNRREIANVRLVEDVRAGVIDLCEHFPIPDSYIG